jgi:hypothetical protein
MNEANLSFFATAKKRVSSSSEEELFSVRKVESDNILLLLGQNIIHIPTMEFHRVSQS